MYSLKEIADTISAEVILGNTSSLDMVISGVAEIEKASSQDIIFISSNKYINNLKNSKAAAIIVTNNMSTAIDFDGARLIVENVNVSFSLVAKLLNPEPELDFGIHPSAVIGDGAQVSNLAQISANVTIGSGVKIADYVYIGPGSFVDSNCVIGKGTHLIANVTVLRKSIIGENCILHSNSVVGGEGFGFTNQDGQWHKTPQLGKVILGDRVEIGSSSTVDCGALGDTILANGVKLDNQIQIGHNTTIGENTAIAGSTGIAGSANIGANCTIGGLVGIAGHIEIVDNVHITAMSMVTKPIKSSGVYSSGWPVQEAKSWLMTVAKLRKLIKPTK